MALEGAPQFAMVVELAVLNRHDLGVLAENGLMSAVDVDDGKSPHTECNAGSAIRAPVAWTAMTHDVRHRVQGPLGQDVSWRSADLGNSADPAHLFTA